MPFPMWTRKRLQRRELTWLAIGLITCLLLFVFVRLASEVMEGETHAADTRILRNGTAYQTDVGMTGPYDSIIGVEVEAALSTAARGGSEQAAKSSLLGFAWDLQIAGGDLGLV